MERISGQSRAPPVAGGRAAQRDGIRFAETSVLHEISHPLACNPAIARQRRGCPLQVADQPSAGLHDLLVLFYIRQVLIRRAVIIVVPHAEAADPLVAVPRAGPTEREVKAPLALEAPLRGAGLFQYPLGVWLGLGVGETGAGQQRHRSA